MKRTKIEEWRMQTELAVCPFPDAEIPYGLARRLRKDQTQSRFQLREKSRKNLKIKENKR